jgi:hypothetical protein
MNPGITTPSRAIVQGSRYPHPRELESVCGSLRTSSEKMTGSLCLQGPLFTREGKRWPRDAA